MLIEKHSDQQRERVGLEQSIGLGILDQLEGGHPMSLERVERSQ